MIRTDTRSGATLALLTLILASACSSPTDAEAPDPDPAFRSLSAFAAEGRVEGAHETVAVGSAASGIVATVDVQEGEVVAAGQVLATLACGERRARVSVAQERLAQRRRELEDLRAGGRSDEIARARALLDAAEAERDQARREARRVEALKDGGDVVPQSEVDRARTDLELSQRLVEQRRQELSIASAAPTEEKLALAEARIQLAEAELEVERKRRDECEITAPRDGTILRVNARVGELVSLLDQEPLFLLSDLRERRIRAEIDERFVPLVALGQPVRVLGGSSGDPLGAGTVLARDLVMGRKTVRSLDPAEKNDRDVLEVLVGNLDEDFPWPVGLRVTLMFAVDAADAERSEDRG